MEAIGHAGTCLGILAKDGMICYFIHVPNRILWSLEKGFIVDHERLFNIIFREILFIPDK